MKRLSISLFFLSFVLVLACKNPTSRTVVVPSVTSVTITYQTLSVAKGNPITFNADVVVKGGASKTVTWSVSGNQTLSSNTKFGTGANSNILTVGADENSTTLTVTATSTYDQNRYDSVQVTVTGEGTPTVTGVSVNPSSVNIAKGNSRTFTATVSGTNSPSQDVTWSVSGNKSIDTKFGTGEDSNKLIVAENETALTLTVTATSTAAPSVSGTAAVTVVDQGTPTISITVSPKSTSGQAGGDPITFTATIEASNMSEEVEWSVSGNSSIDTKIHQWNPPDQHKANLVIDSGETAETLTVTVKSKAEESEFDTATVTVTAASTDDVDVWLVGIPDDFNSSYQGTLMTKETDGTFTWKGDAAANRTFRFSLTDRSGTDYLNKWWGDWLTPDGNGGDSIVDITPGVDTPALPHNGETENNWRITANGYYEFSLDSNATPWVLCVEKPVVVDSITIDNYPSQIVKGGTSNSNFTAAFGPESKNPNDAEVIWAVTNSSISTFTGNTLTVPGTETKTSLTITASAGNKTSQAVTVTVKDPAGMGDSVITLEVTDIGGDYTASAPSAVIHKTGSPSSVTFTITGPVGAAYTWYVDSAKVSGTTGNTVTFNASAYPEGYHSVLLVIEIGAVSWSPNGEDLGLRVEL